jgi:hypothetical protein
LKIQLFHGLFAINVLSRNLQEYGKKPLCGGDFQEYLIIAFEIDVSQIAVKSIFILLISQSVKWLILCFNIMCETHKQDEGIKKMLNSVHIPYKSSMIASSENINFHAQAEKFHLEFNDLVSLPPLSRDMTTMKMEEIEISDEYRFFFESIIGDFEQSLSESYEWMRSRSVAA